jgi:hypothetical protein
MSTSAITAFILTGFYVFNSEDKPQKPQSNFEKLVKEHFEEDWDENDGCGNFKRAVECPGEHWILGRKNIKNNH